MVNTLDSEFSDPSLNLGGTSRFILVYVFILILGYHGRFV